MFGLIIMSQVSQPYTHFKIPNLFYLIFSSKALHITGFDSFICLLGPKSLTVLHGSNEIVANSSMSVELCLEIALAAVPPYPYRVWSIKTNAGLL
jgi:hypothetical protein